MTGKARRVRHSKHHKHKVLERQDQTIATGVVKRYVPASTVDAYEYFPGDKVDIAKITHAPDGSKSYRVKGTIRWLPETEVKITGKLVSPKKKFKAGRKSDTKKDKGRSRPKKTAGETGMDKQNLKTLIKSLSEGDEVTVTVRSQVPSEHSALSAVAGQTLKAKVLETKRGRGKGGSQLMKLQAEDGTVVTTGTPHSESLINVITADGTLHGYESEADVPKLYEPDAGNAARLKEIFTDFIGEENARVTLEASAPEFDGTFSVKKAEQLRGRHGQVRLTLTRDDGSEIQAWSYRHSGVIQTVTVEDDDEDES